MAMILSNFSSAAKSKLIKSKFSKEPLRVVSVLMEQHNYSTLVVSRLHKGSHLTSLLSIGDNDNFANFSRQHRSDSLFPVASCKNKILLNGSNVGEHAAIWNPTTGEIQTLPRTDPRFELDHTVYGLGFDPKTEGDYKVIRVVKVIDHEQDELEVELYSHKTDSWEVYQSPPKDLFPTGEPSLFINGSYYWPGRCARKPAGPASVILRFHFANEKLSADIPLPDDFYNPHIKFILAEFEGSLAVVVHSKPNFGLEMWVWNEESLSWSRRREFEWATINSRVAHLLGLFNNDQLYFQDFEGELVLFDCGTGELKNLGLKSDPPGHYGAMDVFAYVQSSEEEEVKHRENERKMKRYVGTLINSTTFTSKLAPIDVNDDSKQKPNNNSNKQKLLFCHDFERTIYFSHNSLKDNSSCDVLFNFPTSLGAQFMIPTASCNSPLLLCCADSDSDSRGEAALWNPTTDEVKKLPDLQVSSPYRVFDTVWYGFGFDPKADEGDYKVIRFTPVTKENMNFLTVRTELYSLKSDSWKDLTSPFSRDELHKQPSLYINGFCYWVATWKSYIVSFDFANEKFSSAPHIPLPTPKYEKKFLLTQFHGSLAALVYARTDDECSSFDQNTKPLEILELWIWNKDGESSSWTRESVIHVPVGVDKPLGLFGNDQLYLQGSNGEILIFDCAKGGELKSLCPSLRSTMENWGDLRGRRDYIFPYVESSFPLKNGEKIIRASHKIIDD